MLQNWIGSKMMLAKNFETQRDEDSNIFYKIKLLVN